MLLNLVLLPTFGSLVIISIIITLFFKRSVKFAVNCLSVWLCQVLWLLSFIFLLFWQFNFFFTFHDETINIKDVPSY